MDLPYELAHKIIFKRRKVSVAADYRPITKIAQILLMLYLSSRNKSANLFKLQLLNWAFKSKDRDQVILSLIQDPLSNYPLVSMDPAVNRALQFAIADKLIAFSPNTGKFTLLKKGEEFAKSIIESKDILEDEKELLGKIGTRLTDKIISLVFKVR
ncbi:hypothetical protein [Brevibacillus brevis]|uniref:hypothetical protein n=1 Tax=Brevibacillus brevis TaxID=1393 RepID=UPI000D0E5F2E|nr:hypothetical protein [Brevibacillus brevis]PSJ64991.1 hypothetical protein C7J99_30355 [Brevibacillus brevis]RED29295.1 hypothetical protein DES34_10682 [Brevibacillus brevis]GEC91473.1 hypothetical protein BBR01nite_38040 [Brevibacillus brevis]VEF87896.1 Uncharacterised protein [Brevibacillus brevis]